MCDNKQALMDSNARLQEFLEKRDLGLLDEPIVFEKNPSFKNYLSARGALLFLHSFGFASFFHPRAIFAPRGMYDDYRLVLTRDAVTCTVARNDHCLHVLKRTHTVPLEALQDVDMRSHSLQERFGLQQLSARSGSGGGSAVRGLILGIIPIMGEPRPEIEAAFLKDPRAAHDAILLAAKLRRAELAAMAAAP